MNKFTTGGFLALVLGSPFLLAGCDAEKGGGGQQGAVQSVEVQTQTIKPQPRPIEAELPGRISPVKVAEIRARVAGIVQKRHFVEGANVKAGDLLFTIDPAPFEAALARTQGALARADAQIKQTQSVVNRYEPLAKANAVSQQEYDDAVAALQTAKANRMTAQAEVKTAQLDLNYASVRAPISGRIGRSLVSEGSLVGQGETTRLALVQQMDPIYADFTQPVSAVLRLRQAMAEGQVSFDAKEKPNVSIAIDGTRFTAKGHLMFSDVSVDPSTGQVLLRGLFPNPQGTLLPGMYVRVKTEQGVDERAIFLPQRAILRSADGQAKVMTVNAAGTAEERVVQTGAMQGVQWQVTSGLNAGDQVIINGADKIAAGTPVTVLQAGQGGTQ